MKKLFGLFALVGGMVLASAQAISFDQTTLDYGTVAVNGDGNRVFTVKNTGTQPLVISSVKPSCGCTSPDWSKDPIMPGQTGQIKVHYNTGTTGDFLKMIEVFSNDPQNGRSVLYIKGKVDPNMAAGATVATAQPTTVKTTYTETEPAKVKKTVTTVKKRRK